VPKLLGVPTYSVWRADEKDGVGPVNGLAVMSVDKIDVYVHFPESRDRRAAE